MHLFAKDTKEATTVWRGCTDSFPMFKEALMLEKVEKDTALQVFVKTQDDRDLRHKSSLVLGSQH